MNRKAAILGASGLVGSHLLNILLEDPDYDEVIIYARHTLGRDDKKITEVIGNLLDDNFFDKGIPAEDVYCCIGTTQSKTPDLNTYKHIDYGIPVRAAQAGLKSGMHKFLVISSIGANAKSKMFYTRIKGQMEETLLKMSIPRLHIFRPSMILGKRDEFRFGEKVAKAFLKVFGWAVPAKYKGIKAQKIAEAMHKVAKSIDAKEIYRSAEISRLV